MVATTSSYLRYLPPVLWAARQLDDKQSPTTDFVLGTFLLAFEKVLTGLDDDIVVRHGTGVDAHTHDSLATTIAQIPQLFDPWRTPPQFLPWLASWVALTFPTLQDKPLWDEYQQRKATSEIANIHARRGLKDGLNRSLELFSVIPTRPRVAIDDGNKLLATTPVAGKLAPVTAFVSQGPTVTQPIGTASAVVANGLVRPRCIATGSDGSLFVGDFGAARTVSALPSRVWRLDPTGAADTAGTPPLPRPLGAGTALTNVVAIAVCPPRAGRPETLYFVDGTKKLLSLGAPYDAGSATLERTLPTVTPMAMAVDVNGDVLVLDRGNIAGDPALPKVVVVRPGAPDAPQVHPLTTVVEPLSLMVRSDGTLIIGDGGHQDQQDAANLVRVDRSNTGWTETPLLPAEPAANPLVSPTALVAAADGAMYVLDTGLRPFATGDLLLTVARPAAVFRADLGGSRPSLQQVTRNGNLVFPTGMAAQGDRLLICDPGQLESGQQDPVLTRLSPFRFCVVVHFEASSLPDGEPDRTRVIGRVATSIRSVVDQLRPAHTLATLIIAG